MRQGRRLFQIAVLVALAWVLLAGPAYADPLDDATAKLGGFLQKAGAALLALVPSVSGVAISALAAKRAAAKAMGEEEGMVRATNNISEVLKLTAVGMAAGLLVAIAGSVLA